MLEIRPAAAAAAAGMSYNNDAVGAEAGSPAAVVQA